MLDKTSSHRLERRRVIIWKKLQKYNIDIVALSEVRLAENDSIREETGYTFYWSGKTSISRSESGVAFAVKYV